MGLNFDFFKVAEDFFNTAVPCPANIENCEELRKQFFDKVESLKQNGGCNACRLRNLKTNYYQVIKSNMKSVDN